MLLLMRAFFFFFSRASLLKESHLEKRAGKQPFLPSFPPSNLRAHWNSTRKKDKEKSEKKNYKTTTSLLVLYLYYSALSTPAPDRGLLDECSHDARRHRCDVGPREDRRERRRSVRDHDLRILAEDAVDRR